MPSKIDGLRPPRIGRYTPGVIPKTRCARSSDGVSIAYQVMGDGPPDLVWVPGWISQLEAAWDEPTMARFFERLASFSRLILFDKRGTRLSDRVSEDKLPSLETRMDDVRTVCDAIGTEQAAPLGVSEGAPMCLLFAASIRPERPPSFCSAATPVDNKHEITSGDSRLSGTTHSSRRSSATGAARSGWM